MHRKPDATGAAMPLPLRLLHCLLADDPDRAIELGLMDYAPSPGDDALDPAHPDLPQRLLQAQARLRTAWAARERYRARTARLARRAAEREARRAPPPAPGRPAAPALPPLAAAILARAKAKAAAKGQS
ncbi:hypothetical protein [[Pseudomonas] boreopolis]|uniref:hypothetical protein n=1 Tax=Xanthomonas boreopolis TaxID=86183 RepID=UPI003D505655